MKLYVKAYTSYRSDLEDTDIKKELKEKYKVDIRRKDGFIHMGLLGALRLQEKVSIETENELYITSGLGNINILEKINDYVIQKKGYMKLFDFINMLGNTTSYYVASELGIKGKSIFQIADNFTYFNTLVSIYASLSMSKKEAVLGSIDLLSNNEKITKCLLDLPDSTSVVSSVNYQKLSLNAQDALCEVEFDIKLYSLDEVNTILENESSKIVLGKRCGDLKYEKPSVYFETYASYVLNEAIKDTEDTLYVECYNDKYKILRIKNL